MNHTPGPWKLENNRIWGPPEPRTVDTQDMVRIAEMAPNHKVDNETNIANARLIAAAPALVEALRGLLDITDDPNLNWVEILDKIEKAKKALTLAEGKEQS